MRVTIGVKDAQRIDGCRDDAWTMDNKKKKKRKEKEKVGEEGRGRGGGRPLRKRLGGRWASLYS